VSAIKEEIRLERFDLSLKSRTPVQLRMSSSLFLDLEEEEPWD
jgi:hypothetical protein